MSDGEVKNVAALTRECLFNLKGNSYSVRFPSVNDFIQIESRRMNLTNGTYGYMLQSTLITSGLALDMVDMVATLTVLCPDIIKDLKVNTILELDLIDSKELMTAYNEQVKVWIEGWLKIFRSPSVIDDATK